MYTWEIPMEILVTSPDGLEFKLKYHLDRKRGGGTKAY